MFLHPNLDSLDNPKRPQWDFSTAVFNFCFQNYYFIKFVALHFL